MSSDQQRTLQSELASRLESNPQGNALTFLDSRGRCEWRTFEEFYTASACSASVLHDRGLRAGDGCVLVMPSDEDACQVLLACLILGALPVLIAPPVVRGMHSNLNAVVRHVVGKISARMVVVGDEAVELGTELQKEQADLRTVISPDDFGDHGSVPAPIAAPAASDIGLYQLTSGTTGFPKVCLWRQRGVLASLDGMYAKMELSKDDIFLNWTPLYHDMGLINNFMLCMIHQIPLAMIETTEFLKRPGLWLRGLDVTKSTTTWSPNFGFAFMTQRVKDADIEGVRLDAVKGFWNAAERVHLDTMLAFQKRFEKFGVSLGAMKTNFGCAENVGGATFSDPNGNFVVEHVDPDRLFEDGVAEPIADESRTSEAISVVSVGQPCPGMTVDILSDAGEPLEDGRVGELALNTPSKMEGYVGNPEDTARALRDGRLCTGDMAYKRGDEVFWVGRVQERINVQGKKYDPSDFEKVLLEVAGLRKGCFAAFGVDDVKSGTQRLVIVSETSDKEKIPDTDIVAETKQQIAGQLGTGLNEMILLDPGTMSKTSSGKRRHRFYRQQYIEGKLTTLPNARAIQA